MMRVTSLTTQNREAMGMSIATTINKRTQSRGDPMPVAPLAADKVAQLRAWITNGAQND
jgi:hypothetical protein